MLLSKNVNNDVSKDSPILNLRMRVSPRHFDFLKISGPRAVQNADCYGQIVSPHPIYKLNYSKQERYYKNISYSIIIIIIIIIISSSIIVIIFVIIVMIMIQFHLFDKRNS